MAKKKKEIKTIIAESNEAEAERVEHLEPASTFAHPLNYLLAEYTTKGLILTVGEESWSIEANGQQDSGHISVPEHIILNSARKMFGENV